VVHCQVRCLGGGILIGPHVIEGHAAATNLADNVGCCSLAAALSGGDGGGSDKEARGGSCKNAKLRFRGLKLIVVVVVVDFDYLFFWRRWEMGDEFG
jgi:hypothetical protein